MAATVMKSCYRDYEKFRNDTFITELENELLKYDTYDTKSQHFTNVFSGYLK